MAGEWVFELGNSSDLSKIGELTQARNKQLTLTLNKAGAASFTLPLDDVLAASVQEVSTCLTVRRRFNNNVFNVVWSGYVSGISEQTPNQMTVNCTGWLQSLEKKFIKFDTNFNLTDAGSIAQSILSKINAAESAPAYVFNGITETTVIRTRQYKAYEQVLKIIQDLSDIESGYDMVVDPVTRKLNIYVKAMVDRLNLPFEYKYNIQEISRSSDTSRLVNRIIVQGGAGTFVSQADDFLSQAKYGVFEEYVTLSDVTDQLILAAYANAEIAIRSQPLRIYTFSLNKSPISSGNPKLFIDYNIGDKIYLTARKGRIQEKNKPVRIFSLSVNINETGNEQVSNIQTTANV